MTPDKWWLNKYIEFRIEVVGICYGFHSVLVKCFDLLVGITVYKAFSWLYLRQTGLNR